MEVITKPTVFFDVDDTLVMWNQGPHHPEAVTLEGNGFSEQLVIHQGHIKQMKDHAFRGHYVVVWSAGGWEWALQMVRALGIEQYVNAVMDKPHWIYDDLRADQFIPESIRVYIETYKSRNKGHGDSSNTHAPGTSYAVADADIKEGSPVVIQNGRAYPV